MFEPQLTATLKPTIYPKTSI